MDQYFEGADKLYHYLLNKHWTGQAIVGADPIGKINWRVTRFVKSYTRWLPWKDDLAYLQGQSYWIKANLAMAEITKNRSYLDVVEKTADFVVEKQLDNGAWEHPPIRGRIGFISAVETVWACLGLVAAYKQLNKQSYLDGILKGHQGIIDVIGMRQVDDTLAINYHAHTKLGVPNVTTMYLWLVAEIYHITGDKTYLEHTPSLVNFIGQSQMDNGELQYIYDYRPHFQCFQYNSFQFVDLASYYRLTNDETMRPILKGMAEFLAGGLTSRASCRYDCFHETPETNYWTGALATALRTAHDLGLGNYLDDSEQAFQFLLKQQHHDGGYGYSRYNYKILRDNNSYPRYLAMILHHLLYRVQADTQREKAALHQKPVAL